MKTPLVKEKLTLRLPRDGHRRPRSSRRARAALGLALAGALVAACALAFPEDSRADPPAFTFVPADILVEADSEAGFASVEFTTPTATDDNGDPYVDCDYVSGADFEVGTTTVTCTAEDFETGERSSVSFKVRVLAYAQEEAAAGGVNALLYYTQTKDSFGGRVFKNVRLTIIRKGAIAYQGAVPRYPGHSSLSVNPAGYGENQSVFVRDLDGDGEPEVRLDLFWGGAHCCFWTDVYRYTGSTYQLRPHLWGNATYWLKDLGGDGRLEFVSSDDRFAYAFSAFAFSYLPVQIWSYRGGGFKDVTRRFPRQIRADSAHTWRGFLRLRRARYETEGALAAWAADQYLLGHRALVWKRLGPLARAGKVSGDYPPKLFLRKLRVFLHRHGYR
jgi:hypothetical protein